MTDAAATIAALIATIHDLSLAIGISVAEALEEKRHELQIRRFLRCIPSSRLKVDQVPSFIRFVTGADPTADLLAGIGRTERGSRLDTDAIALLEQQQGLRCALCGRYLQRSAHPEVDHIVPLALGGTNSADNLQLLCSLCNQGKGKLLHWVMAAPYFSEERPDLGARLRYCVLARANGHCQETGCPLSAKVTELLVLPMVPLSQGGRLIFDNLTVLCNEHSRARQQSWYSVAVRQLRDARYPGLRSAS